VFKCEGKETHVDIQELSDTGVLLIASAIGKSLVGQVWGNSSSVFVLYKPDHVHEQITGTHIDIHWIRAAKVRLSHLSVVQDETRQ
jgi:hypothetical protein